MSNNPSNEASIQEQLHRILDDIGDYWQDENRWAMPMKKGELTFEEQILALFAHHQLQLLQRVEDEVIEHGIQKHHDLFVRERQETIEKTQREALKRIRTSIEKGE